MLQRDFVGLCSRNRVEHYIADFACIFYNLASVAVHYTIDSTSLLYVVNNAEFSAVVASPHTMPNVRLYLHLPS